MNGSFNTAVSQPKFYPTLGATFWKRGDGKLHREDGPATVYEAGLREWYIDGEYHREGGPAIEHYDGSEYWYRHGKLHREGGPAIISKDEFRQWWIDDKLHREDGPAIERDNGVKAASATGRRAPPFSIPMAPRNGGWTAKSLTAGKSRTPCSGWPINTRKPLPRPSGKGWRTASSPPSARPSGKRAGA